MKSLSISYHTSIRQGESESRQRRPVTLSQGTISVSKPCDVPHRPSVKGSVNMSLEFNHIWVEHSLHSTRICMKSMGI